MCQLEFFRRVCLPHFCSKSAKFGNDNFAAGSDVAFLPLSGKVLFAAVSAEQLNAPMGTLPS